jgi:hypothetical protein
MAKKTKLTPYDPDKYRDELNKAAWEESGAKTTWELINWLSEQQRIFREAAEARGLSLLDYAIEVKRKQAQSHG